MEWSIKEQTLFLLRPVGSVPFLFEFVSYGVDYPIGQQPEEKVCVRAVVLLVVDGSEVEVSFQLPIGGFYFPGKIVVFPSGLFV